MILVDTSALIDFFKNKNDKLSKIIENNKICTSDIIIMEYLQGVKSNKEHLIIKEWLLRLPNYKITQETYLFSSQIYRKCRKSGITIRKPIDCLIASIAIKNDLPIYTLDKDFEYISKCFNLDIMK